MKYVCVYRVQRVRQVATGSRVYSNVVVVRTAIVITSLEIASVNPVTPASTALEVQRLRSVYF